MRPNRTGTLALNPVGRDCGSTEAVGGAARLIPAGGPRSHSASTSFATLFVETSRAVCR